MKRSNREETGRTDNGRISGTNVRCRETRENGPLDCATLRNLAMQTSTSNREQTSFAAFVSAGKGVYSRRRRKGFLDA